MMFLAQLELELAMFREGGANGEGLWRLIADPRAWAVLITVIGAAGALFATADLLQRDRDRCGPSARLLARSLGLSRRDRRLLGFLARQAAFPSPACLMISRGCFDRAAALAPPQSDEQAIVRLRGRLFTFEAEPVHSGDEYR